MFYEIIDIGFTGKVLMHLHSMNSNSLDDMKEVFHSKLGLPEDVAWNDPDSLLARQACDRMIDLYGGPKDGTNSFLQQTFLNFLKKNGFEEVAFQEGQEYERGDLFWFTGLAEDE